MSTARALRRCLRGVDMGGETISAAVLPLSGTERQNLPDGIRHEARFTLWTRARILEGAVFTVDGERFIARLVQDRDREGGFHRATLVRTPRPDMGFGI